MTVMERFELDRASNSLILRRTLRATPARVFDAWTRAEQIAQWWDPAGAPLAACEIDLRIGGRFRLLNAGAGQHPFEGRYTAIDRPSRLAFEAMGAAGTVVLEGDRDVTHMSVTIACTSPEHLEQFLAMGIADGTAQTLDNLGTYLAKPS